MKMVRDYKTNSVLKNSVKTRESENMNVIQAQKRF